MEVHYAPSVKAPAEVKTGFWQKIKIPMKIRKKRSWQNAALANVRKVIFQASWYWSYTFPFPSNHFGKRSSVGHSLPKQKI